MLSHAEIHSLYRESARAQNVSDIFFKAFSLACLSSPARARAPLLCRYIYTPTYAIRSRVPSFFFLSFFVHAAVVMAFSARLLRKALSEWAKVSFRGPRAPPGETLTVCIEGCCFSLSLCSILFSPRLFFLCVCVHVSAKGWRGAWKKRPRRCARMSFVRASELLFRERERGFEGCAELALFAVTRYAGDEGWAWV